MINNKMQLEEGEISDDSEGDINPYIPLERPAMNYENVNMKSSPIKEEDAREGLSNIVKEKLAFDSDSDSGECAGKYVKMTTVNPKKYTIWNKDPNDFLSDFMNQIGMESSEIDRNVESYPIPPERQWKSHRNRKIPRCKKRSLHPAAKPKVLEQLTVTDQNSYDEVARDISEKLGEPNKTLILKIVVTLGKIKAIELYEKTQEIESEGGMLVVNGMRKRTSGGIFIYLVRQDKDVTGTQIMEIFEENTCAKKKKRKVNAPNKGIKDKTPLNNPPPSPNPEAELPPLPLRTELLSYEDLDFA